MGKRGAETDSPHDAFCAFYENAFMPLFEGSRELLERINYVYGTMAELSPADVLTEYPGLLQHLHLELSQQLLQAIDKWRRLASKLQGVKKQLWDTQTGAKGTATMSRGAMKLVPTLASLHMTLEEE